MSNEIGSETALSASGVDASAAHLADRFTAIKTRIQRDRLIGELRA